MPMINNTGIYRGMPLGRSEDGQQIYTSARDIGNIAAGYIAGINGLSWTVARLGFDGYQSFSDKKISFEGISTSNAQWVGYNMAIKQLQENKNITPPPLIILELLRRIPIIRSFIK